MGNVDYWMGFLAWLNTWSNSLRCFRQRAISDSPSKRRMRTGRHWKRNWLWRKRRSKEHRQREKGGDELSFPSTDSKSHLLTKNCIFTVILIHIRNGFTHPLTLFPAWLWICFLFKGKIEPATIFDITVNTKQLIHMFALLLSLMGSHYVENTILNVFLFKILLLGQ